MSSESDTELKKECNGHKVEVIQCEADAVHYRIRGAEREKHLPPKEDPESEEKTASKKNTGTETFIQNFKRKVTSLLKKTESQEYSAPSPANSAPETSQNSKAGENLECVKTDEAVAQASGTVEKQF